MIIHVVLMCQTNYKFANGVLLHSSSVIGPNYQISFSDEIPDAASIRSIWRDVVQVPPGERPS